MHCKLLKFLKMILLQNVNFGNAEQAVGGMDFFYTLYMPIIIVVALVVILFAFLLFKYTFGNWTPENPNPYAGETLGLPRGIFRGVLTVVLLFVTVLFEMNNLSVGRDESYIKEFMVAFQMMIAFYFGSKVMHHVTASEKKKTQLKEENRRKATEASAFAGGSTSKPSSAGTGIPDDAEAAG